MDNFCQFWNRLNGEPYADVPPPTEYKLQTMGYSGSGAELRPLSDEDMGQVAADDMQNYFQQMKDSGHNPTKLGKPMSDEEFHKFFGLEYRG